jgi:molybdopterin-guanine dinucleotide biosynthesis protein A
LILAGGGAVRLGGVDKAQIQLGGETLLARAIAAIQSFAAPIAISGGPAPHASEVAGLPVLTDVSPGAGPLAGIAAGLKWAAVEGMDWLAVRPVDTPFLDAAAYEQLVAGSDAEPIQIAETTRTQWLVALIRTDLWQAAAEASAGEDKSIAHFAKLVGMSKIPMADLAPAFDNINTPEDLSAARARAETL